MKIIAISGWKGSGKDTLAEHLSKKYGYVQLSFAKPLKDNVASQYRVDRSSIDDRQTKEWPLLDKPVYVKDSFTEMIVKHLYKELRTSEGKSPKDYLVHPITKQALGNPEYSGRFEKLYWTPRALCILEGSTKRSVDPDYWAFQAILEAKNIDPDGIYIISDLRYKSEVECLRRFMDKYDILLTVRINRFATSVSEDPSERDLDDYNFDVVIDNKTVALQEFLENAEKAILEEIL
jgi:hypothetical protein